MKSLLKSALAVLGIVSWFGAHAATKTLAGHDEIWRYRKGTSTPPANWQTAPDAVLDASWLEGQSGFGYADPTPETVNCHTILGMKTACT